MISITIEALTKRFGDVVALDAVNLRIEAGELFFLLGPSGCGKTTLLRQIAGLGMSESGRILFDSEDVTRLAAHKRNTGMMFQSYALWPHMTVAKNVAFGLEERSVPRAEIKERVARALTNVHMDAYAQRKITELSGGQQQRVALARALVIRPRCLLLDEPLSNLDAKLRLEMRGEIRRVCKEFGLTAIYVTHDQKEALSIADRMAIMGSGRIAQIGAPEEIYRRPHSRFVADFIGETNFLGGCVIENSDGKIRVETPHARFWGIAGKSEWQPSPGTNVHLSIRPEAWVIHHEGGADSAADNGLIGQMEERVYLGETAQYRIRCDEIVMKVFELNPRSRAVNTYTPVYLTVTPDDVVILPA